MENNNNAVQVIAHNGEALPRDSSPPGNEAKQPKSRSGHSRRWWILIICALLIVVAVAVGVVVPVVFMSTPNDPSEPAQAPVDVTVSAPGPTEPPAPESSNSPPTLAGETLTALLSTVSLDGGAALRTKSTPQNAALNWLVGNSNLDEYSDERRIQRYVLATFFYSTNGGNWDNNAGWLSDTDECGWYNEAEGPFCWNGVVLEFDLFQNSLDGTIPEELALLSNSLGENILHHLENSFR
jgi:hypothetical protein